MTSEIFPIDPAGSSGLQRPMFAGNDQFSIDAADLSVTVSFMAEHRHPLVTQRGVLDCLAGGRTEQFSTNQREGICTTKHQLDVPGFLWLGFKRGCEGRG